VTTYFAPHLCNDLVMLHQVRRWCYHYYSTEVHMHQKSGNLHYSTLFSA